MALTFDKNGLPACCGLGLVPGDPRTACPRCSTHYDTDRLAARVRDLRLANRNAAPLGESRAAG